MLGLRTASATYQFPGTQVALQQHVTHLLPDIRAHGPLGVTAHVRRSSSPATRNGRSRVVGLADRRAQPCEGYVRLTGGAIEDLVKRYGSCLDTHLPP